MFRRRLPDGKRSKVWTIQYTAAGKRQREQAYTDKKASEQLLAQRQREAARDEVGLGDPYRVHRARPLTEHVEDFLAGIGSRNRTEKHRKLMRSRLLKAFREMKASSISDLDLAAAEVFLGRLMDEAGLAVTTRDHYATALGQFGTWLYDLDRLPKDPFRRLKAVGKPSDAVLERMALTAEQVKQLVAAAESRGRDRYHGANPDARPETLDHFAWKGWRRGTLYLFVALTGLRKVECRGIRWCDLELGEDPWVTPRPQTTKAKRKDPIPLDPMLADRLRQQRREIGRRTGRLPAKQAAVFEVPNNIAERVRSDAAHAGIPVVDDEGRRLDFHALRSTFATLVARAGVPMQIARRLIRHVDPKLTAKHYEKLGGDDLRTGSQLVSASFWGVAATAGDSESLDDRENAE
ncbi:MAG: tyrosine-type recombinase/integrase [bacterium]|nr:tyrosine-type recombinase/integrase [bacterium]